MKQPYLTINIAVFEVEKIILIQTVNSKGPIMSSIWTDDVEIKERKALHENIHVNTVIIGAGMAGVLTAHFLQQNGVECIILEGDRIAGGQTKNTTAKITSQHALKYNKLTEKFGKEKAKQYADANQKAISIFFQIAKSENISCMIEEQPAYLYSKSNYEQIEKEYYASVNLGINADLCEITTLPFKTVPALRFNYQAQFHPLRFIQGIAEKLVVYENTKIISVEENVIQTRNNTVTADNIIITTHYPFVNVPGYYFLRMHQERSYVIALENAPNLNGMYYGIDTDSLSLRNSGKYLLLGAGNHRTGENSEGGKYEILRKYAKEYFSEAHETAFWSAQDCIPLDGVPYIGNYSASTPHMFVATGFQKWGMTSSMVSAMVIADLIQGKPHPYEIFSPQRFNISASAKQLYEDGIQSIKGLTNEILHIPDETINQLTKGHGGIVEYDNKKIGVYKNEAGEAFIVSTRCTHLGCQLEWNPDELSWDCPCHGSRFDYKGNLIDNPALKNLK